MFEGQAPLVAIFLLVAVVLHRGFIRLFFRFANTIKIVPKSKQSNNDDNESCGPVSPPVNKELPAILLANKPCVIEVLGFIPPKIPGSAKSQPKCKNTGSHKLRLNT